jgi:hypothetical protein
MAQVIDKAAAHAVRKAMFEFACKRRDRIVGGRKQNAFHPLTVFHRTAAYSFG